MLPVRFYYAFVKLLLRSHYDNEGPATLSLHGVAAGPLLGPRKLSYASVSPLYHFYIKSEVRLIDV